MRGLQAPFRPAAGLFDARILSISGASPLLSGEISPELGLQPVLYGLAAHNCPQIVPVFAN